MNIPDLEHGDCIAIDWDGVTPDNVQPYMDLIRQARMNYGVRVVVMASAQLETLAWSLRQVLSCKVIADSHMRIKAWDAATAQLTAGSPDAILVTCRRISGVCAIVGQRQLHWTPEQETADVWDDLIGRAALETYRRTH